MPIRIFANPRSGSGKAAHNAQRAHAALRAAGIDAHLHHFGPALPTLDTDDLVAEADALVIAGGDGSLRSYARYAARHNVPIYHLPSGNENLFARHFGMTADPHHLINTLRRQRITRIDMGQARWHDLPDHTNHHNPPTPGHLHTGHLHTPHFCIMASLGPDAGVCHRLDALRTRPAGHLAYARPLLDEFAQPAFFNLDITADGQPLARGRGLFIAANLPCYALGINPCPHADPHDGLLDALFIPADTPIDAITALARLRFRLLPAGAVRTRARTIRVTLRGGPGDSRLQLDGDSSPEPVAVGETPQLTPLTLVFTSQSGVLPVFDAR